MLVHQAELAGRLVSMAMGALLILPVYFLALQFYGRGAALTAATVTAVHPYLITYSGTVYCEPSYLTVVFSGLCLAVRAVQRQTTIRLLFAGVFFALAYLIRPEALLYALLSAAMLLVYSWLVRRKDIRRTTVQIAAMLSLFAALIAPYIIWLHGKTGQWRLECKSPLNSTTRFRMQQGMPDQEAMYGIDSDLTEQGVWIQSNLATIRAPEVGSQQLLSYLSGQAKGVLFYVTDMLSGFRPFGCPPLFGLAVLGLFVRPWRREAAAGHLLLFGVLALAGAGLFMIYYYADRFLLIFLVALLVWSSAGAAVAARWMLTTARQITGRPVRHSSATLAVLTAAIVATVPLFAAPSAIYTRGKNRDSRALKAAGEWLDRHANRPKVVMDVTTVVSFHARANFVPYPYADAETTLRYLDKRGVNYLVLGDHYAAAERSYLSTWIESGIPDGRTKEIYRATSPWGGRIRIFERSSPGR